MNKIFPSEIIENSTQSHFVENTTKSQAIYMLVLIFILVIGLILPIVSVDITNQTRGIIRTQNENTQLQTAIYGEVNRVTFSENQYVTQGDVLLELNTDKIDEQVLDRVRQLEENNQFISDLNGLIKNSNTLQSAKYLREYAQYSTKIDELSIQLEMTKREYDLEKKLFAKEVVAEMDYLQQKNKYDVAISQLSLVKNQYQNQWQSELTRLVLENKNIESSIMQLEKEKRLYVITAPVSGVITDVVGIKKGSFLVPNQVVGQISPDEEILVECYVSPADIGFIKKGQLVKFQLDAYNYNQWSTAEGLVSEISTDISTLNNEPVFKVRCVLNTEYLQLKNGYKGYLKKGMTLTTRFYLTERTLWQLLFDKMDDWMNPKLMATNNN